jgi:uncharacterized protein (TIGR00725 family)
MQEKIITVFGSSRPIEGDADYEEARLLGRALAERGFAVCTGGYGGVMEAVSRGTKDAGGKTYGATAEFFAGKANAWVDVEVRKKTWAERLFALIEMGHGFVVCKGGTGTLAELAVVWEMLNKQVIREKQVVVVGEFWAPILDRIREVEQAGPSTEVSGWEEAKSRLVHRVSTVQEAADYLAEALQSRRVQSACVKD